MKGDARISASSLALSNLRAIVILTVVAVHSFVAYLGSATRSGFGSPPYLWRAVPIVDTQRWFGFDVLCAWQDIYLMVLMFFLSALFTWQGLARRGTGRFLHDRALRLGIPFLFGTFVLMPIALYPVYRTRSGDPGMMAYFAHLVALPFWDDGPMWFLWQLLVLTGIAAALYRFAPRFVEALAERSASAGAHPGRYFLLLSAAAILAYVPLALAFTPMAWAERGPLSMQLSRPLIYLVFYLAGLGIGAQGFDRGLLEPEGTLARGWARWLAGALLSFILWLALMAISVTTGSSPMMLRVATDAAFALAATWGCFAALALSLRFVALYSHTLDGFAKNGFGVYVVHYPIVVWVQYALLGLTAFALAKAMIVLALALALSLAAVACLRSLPFGGARVLGETPRPIRVPRPSGLRLPERPAPIPLATLNREPLGFGLQRPVQK